MRWMYVGGCGSAGLAALGSVRRAAAASRARGVCRAFFGRSGRVRAREREKGAAQGRVAHVQGSGRAAATMSGAGDDDLWANPKPMSGAEVRTKFLEFFKAAGHPIKPSSSLIPTDPTVMLTIAGMLQFKPVFLGEGKRPDPPRATTTQKCVRTNDIENVGVTARHHTFFEMLGNFSFGDYFKREAIQYAWKLSTEVYGLPRHRVFVSVFQEDQEAYDIWHNEVGIPKSNIARMTAKDNFWAAGPTGPCGPCSELYYDFRPDRGLNEPDNLGNDVDLDDDTRFIEFYNLVFMQYDRDTEGNLNPLAAPSIDTGMGLERMAQILQGVPNNYETDLIRPIIDEAVRLSKLHDSYDSLAGDELTKTRYKVVGDHVRAVVHMLGDGVFPSNVGRGYILRRLIRRVIRTGRQLGIEGDPAKGGAFTAIVAEKCIELSHFKDDLNAERARIMDELDREEGMFLRVLSRGEKLLSDMLDALSPGDPLPGANAFTLFDTFGFPLELTEEIASERGNPVDREGYEAAMAEQKDRSRSSATTTQMRATAGALQEVAREVGETRFCGFDRMSMSGMKIAAMLADGEVLLRASAGDDVQIVLGETPFYAEGGGQVGDKGFLRTASGAVVQVRDTTKGVGGVFLHTGTVEEGSVQPGDEVVEASVDVRARRRTMAHHTATHLLQSSLRKVIGEQTSQAGSLVNPDKLRFDFTCKAAPTPAQLSEVEANVNRWITQGTALSGGLLAQSMPIAEAKERGATAMFGEKYGDVVRVVDYPGVSMELCGGTHVENLGDIGGFKITSCDAVASGVRRIEAVAGPVAMDFLLKRSNVLSEVQGALACQVEDVPARVASLQAELRAARAAKAAVQGQLAVMQAKAMMKDAIPVAAHPEGKVLVGTLEGADAESLNAAAIGLQKDLGDASAIVLGTVLADGKVSLVAAFGPDVVKGSKLAAGKFIGPVAKKCGGGGGGKPNVAQAGARDSSAMPAALEEAREELIGLLGGRA